MEDTSTTTDDPSQHDDLLHDSQTPHSLQHPPRPLSSAPAVDLARLSAQDAADRLFSDAEILAPMVRASTTPLRALALAHGASLCYTEELIDRAILPAERVVNAALGTIDYRVPLRTYSKKVQKRMLNDTDNPGSKDGAILLRIDPALEKNRLIYQVGTGEAKLALEAARKVLGDVDGIDVNMGCPKKFSVSGGMGSALLTDATRACDILSTLRRNLGGKPVSAKIRLLDPTDPRPTVDFARALVQAGANAVAIHGRIVGDESHTAARWDTLAEVVRQVKRTENVPVVVNGDLYTRADIREMKRRTGCDGVMLARPALYNVSLFRRGAADDDGAPPPGGAGAEDDGPSLARFQASRHGGRYGYASPLLRSRTTVVQEYLAHCVRYQAHSKNAKYVVCEMMNSRRAPTPRVPFLDMGFAGGQTMQEVCKCRSLDDLVRVWDVQWSVPRKTIDGHVTQSTSTNGTNATNKDKTEAIAGTGGDLHNYDDRYFLDSETFRTERAEAVAAALTSANGPKEPDGATDAAEADCDREGADVCSGDNGTARKRPKL